jgi:hypothetical protein
MKSRGRRTILSPIKIEWECENSNGSLSELTTPDNGG